MALQRPRSAEMWHFHRVLVLLNMATFAPNDDAAGRRCAAPFPLSSCGCHYLMDQAAGRSASGMPAADSSSRRMSKGSTLAGWLVVNRD